MQGKSGTRAGNARRHTHEKCQPANAGQPSYTPLGLGDAVGPLVTVAVYSMHQERMFVPVWWPGVLV